MSLWFICAAAAVVWLGVGYFAFVLTISLDWYGTRVVAGSWDQENFGDHLATIVFVAVISLIAPVTVWVLWNALARRSSSIPCIRQYGILFTRAQARRRIAQIELGEREEEGYEVYP